MSISKHICTLAAVLLLSASAMAVPVPTDSVVSLNGQWRFTLEKGGPETFYTLDYSENADWHDLAVPGNWEMAGYSPATYWQPDEAAGDYRKWIEIPASWAGRRVLVNFDGVQNGAEIWLNGRPVPVTEPSWGRSNYHESGWTAWQADLTDAARFGERNLLAIRVTKKTQSSDLDSGDYYFLGGIYRPVTLFAVPTTHISDLTIQTRLLPQGKAEVKVIVDVTGPAADSATVGWHILDGLDLARTAVKDGRAELTWVCDKPRLWSAEHPNLYPLTVSLFCPGQPVEQVTRKFGIREITIKNGILLVNGVPIKLAGICRHDVSAEDGTAVGEKLWRKDLTLMKAANINAIRTSHYPYGSGFYDLCDEMGFYVADELPYCWCPTDTDALAPAFTQRARETIARDKNHPSIIIWAVGNENKQGKNLRTVADLVKQLDPTRPRLVSCIRADVNNVEFDDDHYTPPEKMQANADDARRRAKWPAIYLEDPNVWDVRMAADWGALDIWAQVIKRSFDVVWKNAGIPGLFLWEWQDRAVADKCPTKLYRFDAVTGINYVKTKGLVDAFRNPRPDYYHVKMAYAPVSVAPNVDLKSMPGTAVLHVTNRYSFTNLSELRANWQLLKAGKTIQKGQAHLALAPRTTGKVALRLPRSATNADALLISFDDPRGWNVATYQCQLAKPKPAPNRMLAALPDGLLFPRLNLDAKTTNGDSASWLRAYRFYGKLINVTTEPPSAQDLSTRLLKDVRSLDADVVLSDEQITPALDGFAHNPKAVVPDPNQIAAHVRAEFANGKFSYRIDWKGAKANVEQVGWVFDMPKQFDRFSWDRSALWSYYPKTHIGRPTGTALPDTANVHVTKITRPDAFDFVSTKYDCNWATLTDAKGRGLRVELDNTASSGDAKKTTGGVRAGITPNGYELVVNQQCSPPNDISTNAVTDLYLNMSAGDHVEGSFRIGSNKTE